MKESIGDKIVDKVLARYDLMRNKVQERYKSTRPFRSEPVSNDMSLYIYENMTSEDVSMAIQKYGKETLNSWMGEMEMLKQRRGVK